MYKKFIAFLLTTLSLASPLAAYQTFPTELTVTERWLSFCLTFDIRTDQEYLGTVHRKFFSWTPEYHLLDPQGEMLAVAKMRFFNRATIFDIKDFNQAPLGVVKEEESWLFPTFTIISPAYQILGEAVMNFWGTKFTINDPIDNHVIATISRPFWRLKSDWKIEITDLDKISVQCIHPHLLMTVAAFQVDREYWNRYSDDIEIKGFYKYGDLESSSSAQPFAEKIKSRFQSELANYQGHFDESKVTKEDFEFIESIQTKALTPSLTLSSETDLESVFTQLFSLFSSEELSDSQKAALYVMLERVLNRV